MGKEGPVVAAQGGSSWAGEVPGYIQTPLALSPFLNLARFQLFPFSGLLNGVIRVHTSPCYPHLPSAPSSRLG